MARYIDANKLIHRLKEVTQRKGIGAAIASIIIQLIESFPAADVVEVKKHYHEGDVCIYPCYTDSSSKSRAVVQITKILSEEKGIAEIKFLKVVVDDTGNGFFDYLYRTGKTMNASFKYLKNITPLSYEKKGEQNG